MDKQATGRKRRMDDFELAEISFVNIPAQEPALAAIIKNGDEDTALEKATVEELLDDDLWMTELAKRLPRMEEDEERDAFVRRFMSDEEARKQFPDDEDRRRAANWRVDEVGKNGDLVALQTSSENGHSHGVSIGNYDGRTAVSVMFATGGDDDQPHDHQIVFENGQYVMTENHGHTHELDQDQLRNIMLSEITKTVEDQDEESTDEVEKSQEKTEMDDLEKAKADIERLTKVAELTDAQKAHFNSLSDREADAFLNKSAQERADILDTIEKANEVVYTDGDGTDYRKNDDPRLIAMAKKMDEDRKVTAAVLAKAEDDRLAKKAESYKFLKGELDVRKALVKAVESIEDEETQKAAFDVLDAANKTVAPYFKTVGVNGDITPNARIGENGNGSQQADAELTKRAEEIRKSDGKLTFVDAYAKACADDPDLAARAVG